MFECALAEGIDRRLLSPRSLSGRVSPEICCHPRARPQAPRIITETGWKSLG